MKLPRGYKLQQSRFGLSFITDTKGRTLVHALTDEAALAALNILRNGEVLSTHKVSFADL